MKGNSPLFPLQRASSEKLELRLGPPLKEEDHKTLLLDTTAGHESPSNLPEIQGGKLFHAPMNCGSLPISSFSAGNVVKNGVKVWQQSSFDHLGMQCALKKGASPPPSGDTSSVTTTLSTCSQKRNAPYSSLIGWPPVCSLRKKSTTRSSSSLKPCPELSTQTKEEEDVVAQMVGNSTDSKGLYVKINMDGVPIGRKVNLRAYNNYESLSCAVDQLFGGLLAAQRDALFASRSEIKLEYTKNIAGQLDGNGEYTLVYEDNEGDKILVGDVPWNMFLSTVKRLRVLKRSEIPSKQRSSIQMRSMMLPHIEIHKYMN